MTFETLTSIKPYGGRDSNVMFDPLAILTRLPQDVTFSFIVHKTAGDK